MYIIATQKLHSRPGGNSLSRLVLLIRAEDYTDDMSLLPFFSENEYELSCPVPLGKRFVAVIPGDSVGVGKTYKASEFPEKRLREFLERHGIQ